MGRTHEVVPTHLQEEAFPLEGTCPLEEGFRTPSAAEEEASRQLEAEAEAHRADHLVHMAEEAPEVILGRRQEGRPEEDHPDQGRQEEIHPEDHPEEGGHQEVQEAEDRQAGQEAGRRLLRQV